MTWTQTHRRTEALREIEAISAQDANGALPWREEYAEIFGSREQLVALLRARWQTRLTAQLDPHLTEDVQDSLEARVRRRSVGLLRILDRLDRDELAPALSSALSSARSSARSSALSSARSSGGLGVRVG